MKIIEETNTQLKNEAKKREEMESLLREMEQRMVVGGHALANKEKEQAIAQREMQKKFEREKRKQAELLQVKEAQEAELLEKE